MMNQEKIELINFYVKVDVLLGKYWIGTGGDRNVPCPFHDDNSPSAHVYDDEDGQSLHCFTCARRYKAYDIMLLFNEDPERVYRRIVQKYGKVRPKLEKSEKEVLLSQFPTIVGLTIEEWCSVVQSIHEQYLNETVRG